MRYYWCQICMTQQKQWYWKWTETQELFIPSSREPSFFFFDQYLKFVLLWPQTVLSISNLTALNYLGHFSLQFYSYSLLHDQDFNWVIHTGIKFFAFQRIKNFFKDRSRSLYINILLCLPKKANNFFHCLIFCICVAEQQHKTI